MSSVWIPHGFCVDFVWVPCGFFMDSVRSPLGICKDAVWMQCGLRISCIRIPYGLSRLCLYYISILYGFPVRILCFALLLAQLVHVY
jgi:hypothetical protein